MRWLALGAVLFLLAFCHTAQAAITVDPNNVGATDIVPDDPTTWTDSTVASIGSTSTGSIVVDADSDLVSASGSIGLNSHATGQVTVDGAGSTWTVVSGALNVGNRGSGTLNITNDGAVTVSGPTWVARYSGSSGEIRLHNGWLSTGGLVAAAQDLTGSGTIATHSLVSDIDLVFDATRGLSQSYLLDDLPGQNVTVNLELDGSGSLGVGHAGTAAMSVSDGVTVASTRGYLGYQAGSSGSATVSGTGSTWTTGNTYVGYSGTGTLNILNGGTVSGSSGNLGGDLYATDGTGHVIVDGIGSTWSNSSSLRVGYDGHGTLGVTGGATASSTSGKIGFWHTATGEVTIDGIGSTWTNSGSLEIGDMGDGVLDITGGGTVSNIDSYLGRDGNATGLVSVDGPGSAWNNSSVLHVGYFGDGELSITGGATVSSSGSNYPAGIICNGNYSRGEVTVDGTGSTWSNQGDLIVGGSSHSNGFLHITGGGLVVATGETWVDQYEGSFEIHFDNGTLTTGGLAAATSDLTGTGTVNAGGLVTDVDLVFDSTSALNQSFTLNQFPGQDILVNLEVGGSVAMGAGYGGAGSMVVSNGVAITSPSGYLGYKSGASGTVTVDGAGSAWTNSDDLYVGREGEGALIVTSGAAASGDSVWIGYESGATGEVTVNGAGSVLTSTDGLRVGRNGDGILNITAGATVISDWSYLASNSSGATGQVTVDGDGSTWINNGRIRVGDDGDGTLSVTGGGAVNSWRVALAVGSGSTGQAHVDGPGSAVTTASNFYIGTRGSGTLTITDGGMVAVAGTLIINSNNSGSDYLNMATGGMLALSGDGDDSLTDFLGLIDGPNVIHYWKDSISGWALITGATYGDDYTLEYLTTGDLAGYTLLTVGQSGIPGDFDGDGDVDGADFLVWQRNPSVGSIAVWETNFGWPLASHPSAVPEPSSVLLVIAVVSFGLSRRCR